MEKQPQIQLSIYNKAGITIEDALPKMEFPRIEKD
jgi:hypothetical protein